MADGLAVTGTDHGVTGEFSLFAVHIEGDVGGGNLSGQVQVAVNPAGGHVRVIIAVRAVQIDAYFTAVQRPAGAGAAKGVLIAALFFQAGEVLGIFRELNMVVAVDACRAGGGLVLSGIARGAAVFHLIRLKSQEGKLRGHFPRYRVAAVKAGVDQADLLGLNADIVRPARAAVALNVLVIAQNAQKHFQIGVAAEAVIGVKAAIGIAGDNVPVIAPGNVPGITGSGGHVRKTGAAGGNRVGNRGRQAQIADNLGRRAAGEIVGRSETAVIVAPHNIQGRNHVHGVLVLDAGTVRELGSSRAEGDEGERHRQRKKQGKELLHG